MGNGIKRRNFMAYAGVASAAAIGGCLGENGDDDDDTTAPTDDDDDNGLAGTVPVEWIGPDWAVDDTQAGMLEEMGGIEEVNTTVASNPEIQAQVLGGGWEEMDIVTSDTSGSAAMTRDNPVTLPLDVDGLDNWTDENISELFTDPEGRLEHLGGQTPTITAEMWVDGDPDTGEILFAPYAYNYDAVGYNPDFVDEVTQWSALFDDQYEGEVTLGETAPITIPQSIMHLLDNDMIDGEVGELNNPDQDQLDTAIDFLIEQKEAGQFRDTWEGYGESVTLMAGEEAVIGDIWQPAALDVRREGTPCTYATMEEGIQGYRFWYGGLAILEGAQARGNVDAGYFLYDNVHLGAWFPGFIQERGYSVPQYENEDLIRDGEDESGEGMGPEYYDWSYRGEATYEPVDEPALFDPADYDWSMEEGEPDNDGSVRDSGPIEERNDRVGFFQIWPDEADYMVNRWEDFLAA